MIIFPEWDEQGCKIQEQLNRFIENAINIALSAGVMAAKGLISVEDSKEIINIIKDLAEQFEATVPTEDDNNFSDFDYLIGIDKFASQKLSGRLES